jgi:hypothetical protein
MVEKLYFKKMVNCPITNNLREHTACIDCPNKEAKTDDVVFCKFRARIGLPDRL